jgi:hypothetical protein
MATVGTDGDAEDALVEMRHNFMATLMSRRSPEPGNEILVMLRKFDQSVTNHH